MRSIALAALFLFANVLSGGAVVHAAETITYTYDALGRLTQVASTGDVNNNETISTTYDPAGNRTNQTVSGAGTPGVLSIGNASVTEGGNLVFTVTRTGGLAGAVGANFTLGGTATSGSDYTAPSSYSVTLGPNVPSQTITIATIDDSVVESAETLTVTLSSPTGGASIGTATGTGTINDNDVAAPTLAIGNASVIEGGALSFTVTRSGNTTSAVSVDYATAGGAATSGSDFTAASGTLNFAANETTKTISVSTADDSTVESAEAMTVTLSNATGGATITTATGTGTINDNDTPVTLSVADASVTEGGSLSFVVTLSQAYGSNVTVSYATSDGTALAGQDYTSVSGTLTFTPGQTSQTATVATTDDDYAESAETLTLTLSSPSGATIADGGATGTINDNDNASVTFAISDASVTEGGNLTFTVTKSGFTLDTLTVNYASADGSAAAGSDYTATSGSLSFSLLQSSKTITVPTINDSVQETVETMSMILTSSSGSSAITDYTGIGTINDDDAPPPAQFAIGNASSTEGGTLTFTVTRSGTTTTAVSVDYATTGGTATSGSDFTAASGTLNFAANETTKTISVSTTDDSTLESTETMTVTLSNATGGATITTATGTGTINDNDTPVTLSVADASVTEGGSLSFVVTRSGGTSSAVSANYATSNGTATSGSDYTAASGTVSFAPGETSKTIAVNTTDDSSSESPETLAVTLSSPSGATLSDATATGTINDNDAPPSFSIADAAATKGNNLTFVVTLSQAAGSSVSVDYATSDGTTNGQFDYDATSGTLTFAVGETSKNITVHSVTTGNDDSNPETMYVTLSSPTGGVTLSDAVGTGYIYTGSVPTSATISIGNASVTEGAALGFTVSRTGLLTSAVSASYATAGGTATSGSDYTAASGTVSFASGETSKTITINTSDDSAVESAETMSVALSSPSNGATIGTATGTGTINDNDGALLSIGNASATEGGTLSFTVTRSGVTSSAVSASYASSNGTANAGSDYTSVAGTVSFASGETTKTITINTANDTVVESAETLTLTLSNPSSGVTISGATGTGTINDNDTGFSINNRTVAEGTAFSFTVTRAGVTTGSNSVSYATSNNTATAGSDYTATSGTLTFAAGETSKTITVNTTNDSVAETDETMTVTLSSPTGGAVLTDATGVGTIESDELGFLISDESHNEAGSFGFTVTKVGTATGTTTVSYATSNGTATAGSDYTAKSGTLSFSTSQTSLTISVSISSDTVTEADETVFVTLSSPSAGTLIDATGVGTILDND